MKIYAEKFMARRQAAYGLTMILAFVFGLNQFYKTSVSILSITIMAASIELVNAKHTYSAFVENLAKVAGIIVFIFGLSILYIAQFSYK